MATKPSSSSSYPSFYQNAPQNLQKHLSHPSSSSSSSSSSARIWRSINGGKLATCPICLSDGIPARRAAVISACFHSFCLYCLLRWADHKRTCPLCNAEFRSYFTAAAGRGSAFREHRLRPPPKVADNSTGGGRTESSLVPARSVLRERREEISAANRRWRAIPRRRSFRGSGSISSEEIAQRVLQWRASIYRRGLRAVPFENRDSLNLSIAKSNNCCKEQILRRIEPWIRRELQAILNDPDPTIIVHVATSLYLSNIEQKARASSSPSADSENATLAPLRPFLYEWTATFWHELRCFAESSYAMETYDEVVEYRRSDSVHEVDG